MKIAGALGASGREGQDDAATRARRSLARISPAGSPDDFRACDLVVEAATENFELKLALLQEDATPPSRPGKWLASNTSCISLTKLAAATSRPDRVIGMHFMNPAAADEARRDRARDADVATRRTPSRGRSPRRWARRRRRAATRPGFLVNRILVPMLCEACFALQEGVGTAEDIDTGAKLGLTTPWGPSS